MHHILNHKIALTAALLVATTLAGAQTASNTTPSQPGVMNSTTSPNPLQVRPADGTPNSATGSQTPGTGTGSSRTMRNPTPATDSTVGGSTSSTTTHSTDMKSEPMTRSSSASLPPSVFDGLGATFGCPVIEAYGMTEASHQMASNPLDEGLQRAGSVGLAAGPEIAIAGTGGALLTAGAEGEIVIRGPGVMLGYVSNAKANAEAFHNSSDGAGHWFRTGDLGILGTDGYLTISGRIKELINRGGEKIAVGQRYLLRPRRCTRRVQNEGDISQCWQFPDL